MNSPRPGSARLESDPARIREALTDGTIGAALFARMGRVGELLFCTPAIRAFQQRWPGLRLGFVGSPGAIDVLSGNPYLADRHGLPPEGVASWRSRRRAIRSLRPAHYDLVVHLGGRSDPEQLARQLNARFLHTTSNDCLPGLHIAENKQRLLWPLGTKGGAGALEMFVSEADRRFASDLLGSLPGSGPVVGIQAACHSSGRWRLRQATVKRRWAPDRYAETARQLVERHGARIVVNAGNAVEKREATRIIAPLADRGGMVLDRLPLGRLGAVIEQLSALITVDTGPMHMAAALGTPIVVLHGPTNHHITGPWRPAGPVAMLWRGLDCSPCRGGGQRLPCADNQCLKQITPDDVVAATADLMALPRSRDDASGSPFTWPLVAPREPRGSS